MKIVLAPLSESVLVIVIVFIQVGVLYYLGQYLVNLGQKYCLLILERSHKKIVGNYESVGVVLIALLQFLVQGNSLK